LFDYKGIGISTPSKLLACFEQMGFFHLGVVRSSAVACIGLLGPDSVWVAMGAVLRQNVAPTAALRELLAPFTP
jgi:hypothetical protein